MTSAVSQLEFVTYTRYLQDIKVVEQCSRKNQMSRVFFTEEGFKKLDLQSFDPHRKLPAQEVDALQSRVSFINNVHQKLMKADFEQDLSDYSAVAAESYNSYLKTIQGWNSRFKSMPIEVSQKPLEPRFTFKLPEEVANEKALNRYFNLMEQYPKLKRGGDLNDHTKGTYEILYSLEAITGVQKDTYFRLYKKLIDQKLSPADAHETASNWSRIGVVCEDQFWIWVRDAVISPSGVKHTYNRMIWKSDLDRPGGAAALPIVTDPDTNDKKIVVQIAFRHATGSWEFEMPRGASKPGETSDMTAAREVKEETGCETKHLVSLGTVTPDSGLVASIVPIYMGEVTKEGSTSHDKTEAIKGKYSFSYPELLEGFKQGYLEVEMEGKKTQIHLRDPFLAYALLLAPMHGQLA